MEDRDRLISFAIVSIVIGLILMSIATVFLIWFFVSSKDKPKYSEPVVVSHCPVGYYSLPGGDCKAEPTGCPYGDSIPKDSPECAPSLEEQKAQALQQTANVTEITGK